MQNNVLVQHRGNIPLERLGDITSRCRWVFHFRLVCDLVETRQWYVVVMYSSYVVTTFLHDFATSKPKRHFGNKAPIRRTVCALRLVEKLWQAETFASECLNFS